MSDEIVSLPFANFMTKSHAAHFSTHFEMSQGSMELETHIQIF